MLFSLVVESKKSEILSKCVLSLVVLFTPPVLRRLNHEFSVCLKFFECSFFRQIFLPENSFYVDFPPVFLCQKAEKEDENFHCNWFWSWTERYLLIGTKSFKNFNRFGPHRRWKPLFNAHRRPATGIFLCHNYHYSTFSTFLHIFGELWSILFYLLIDSKASASQKLFNYHCLIRLLPFRRS